MNLSTASREASLRECAQTLKINYSSRALRDQGPEFTQRLSTPQHTAPSPSILCSKHRALSDLSHLSAEFAHRCLGFAWISLDRTSAEVKTRTEKLFYIYVFKCHRWFWRSNNSNAKFPFRKLLGELLLNISSMVAHTFAFHLGSLPPQVGWV